VPNSAGVGAYDKVVGRLYGEADPTIPQRGNRESRQGAAQRRRPGFEYWVDFYLLKPRDIGRILYDVLNRGNKLALAFLNDAIGPQRSRRAGRCGQRLSDAPGYAILWSAWQG